ncbi:hypothetical protein PHLGIDRAFT_95856 [Phlebiopsis gigantea 11061_1 CR5-6]|uniref:Cytochrome b561 domain-containing protein n=1 Tax=Phlebiopsis gigantea (strain 11061_1 CR5-6) TaxID=745531 RepID=A0A0C3S0N6_PHLG1|nr:hypothetical protein PHLGIDRAFT_95856 [Phlebiopsis gigantea 11061_1 CR5-6]
MAMGFGSQMANTPMVIMWPNSDGTITLSQRKAPQEVMPTLDASPPRTATAQPALSSLSGSNPKLVFTIPAASSTSNTVIWAFSNVNPDSNAEDATLQIHLNSGPITLDISQTLTSGSKDPTNPVSTIAQTASGGGSGNSTSTSTPSVSDGIPLLPYQKYIVAHAILLVVGFLFLLPLGAIISRYLRTFSPVWFKLHWIIQWVLALPLIVTGFALGVTSVNMAGVPHQNDTHKRWGVAIFVVYIMQLALGAFIHFLKIPVLPLRGRAFQNYFHAVLGIFIIGASFYQVRTGFRTEWPLATGRGSVGNGANVVWIVWLVLILVVYFAGMLFLPRQYKQEEDSRRVALKSSEPSIEMVQGQQRPARTY